MHTPYPQGRQHELPARALLIARIPESLWFVYNLGLVHSVILSDAGYRMKVIELCLSNGFGGLELYAFRASCQLDKKGIECLPLIRRDTLLDKKFSTTGIKPRYLRARNRFLPLLAARELAGLIDDEAIDVLHMHWGKDLVLAVLAQRLAKRPVRIVYTRQMALTRSKHDFFHRFLYKHVNAYVVITKRLQEEARKYLPMHAEDIQLLYYGVGEPVAGGQDCESFCQQSGLTSHSFKIGLFGRIEHGKGQHLLAEATRILAGLGHDVQSVLIGHVMDQEYFNGLMKNMQQAGLSDRFNFFGFHDNPTEIMACFDVVVLASHAETFGLVLAEAMRAGTAVIGSNAGGVPEIVEQGETGLLFEPGNAEDLARAIEKLISDVELSKKIASQGKVFADKNFSEEKHFSSLVSILAGQAES